VGKGGPGFEAWTEPQEGEGGKEDLMDLKNLIVQESGGWLEVTIHRPEVLNALNRATLEELRQVTDALQRRAELRGMILTGAGDRAFVAGADINELRDLSPEGAVAYARDGQKLFHDLERCGKPVIAGINGYALGGGCELALACHIRILARNARIGLPEVGLGVIPGFGGTQRLPRIVGIGRAQQMILTGDPITAEEALRCGLANQVCEQAELLPSCRQIADRIAQRSPRAVRLALEAIQSGRDLPLDAALVFEAGLFGLAAATEDWKEGTTAYLEKRKADFRGR